MHTYRLAVRDDRTVQIYRDDKLIGVRRGEHRTPREPYLQFADGAELEALIEYFVYDIEGPLKPAIQVLRLSADDSRRVAGYAGIQLEYRGTAIIRVLSKSKHYPD